MRMSNTPQANRTIDRRAYLRSVGIGCVVPFMGSRRLNEAEGLEGAEHTGGQTAEATDPRPGHQMELHHIATRYSIPTAFVRSGS